MGYRSDVAFILSDKASKLFNKSLKELSEEDKKDVQTLLNSADEHYVHESGAELWYWTWVKWYSEYKSVSFIENFINIDIKNDEYLLLILGEEIQDINESGSYYDNPFDACIERSIRFFTPKCN